ALQLRASALTPRASTPPATYPFPTRRSSDLAHLQPHPEQARGGVDVARRLGGGEGGERAGVLEVPPHLQRGRRGLVVARGRGVRSEEHTSELQSRFDLVCRLLLEKKKRHHIM